MIEVKRMQTKLRRVFALILLFAVLVGFCVLLTSCNQTILYDVKYDWAELRTVSGELIVGPVSKWAHDSAGHGSDVVYVTINGITYMTHACNVTLMTEKP